MPYELEIILGKETQRKLLLARECILMEAEVMLASGVGSGAASLGGVASKEFKIWANGIRRAISFADILYPGQ